MLASRILVASEVLAEALVLLRGLVQVVGSAETRPGEVVLYVRSPHLNVGDTAVCEVKVEGLTKTISLVRSWPTATDHPPGVG